LDVEIDKMVTKRVIEEVFPIHGQFVSNIFIRPKKNGKIRPIKNLNGLNKFVHYSHFKMEAFTQVLEMVQPHDFFTSLDLTEAYYSVHIHASCRTYLRFT
jgi:hypothetical protein